MLKHVIYHTLEEGIRLLPFLFVAYLIIEWLEHRAGEKTERWLRRAGPYGPIAGALAGVVPQCGFSAVAANLYAGGVISVGTLLAVFLSTSDEMLPILISQQVEASLIIKLLAFKVVVAILVGMVLNVLWRRRHTPQEKTIHELCEQEGCHCENGVLRSALRHTVMIFLFLLLISFLINLVVEYIGEDTLAGLILNRPVVGQLLAGLIGLIPNCASSVVLTELYLEGGMSAGAMLAGLLSGSGVGILVLFRMNRKLRENLMILGLLYAIAVVFGCVAQVLPWF